VVRAHLQNLEPKQPASKSLHQQAQRAWDAISTTGARDTRYWHCRCHSAACFLYFF